MDNRSPSPTPGKIPRVPSAKIPRVPSAKRWGSSSNPPSLKPPSKPSLEPQDQLEVLKPKGRPLSSNVYLKKTIAQGWKAQELPDTELSQGELEKLVGDEVESLGEKKKALQGMLTSQGLATVEQTTQDDWTRGEVRIPDFHCARCRDHFYGLTDELCDEETERLRREEEVVLKKGRSDTSTNTRVHRGLSGKSPRSQHKKLETETNSISANSNQNQKSISKTQRAEDNREERNFDSSEDEPKKGVKHKNNLFSKKEHSLVNSTSSKEIEKENKQNKPNNKTNKQDDNISKSEFQCDHEESTFDNLSRDGTETKIDTSHSRMNPGSQGVELGAGGDGDGTRGSTSEIGGVVSGKGRRRGVKKVAGGISSGEDTESDSEDGVAERNKLGKKRFGKKSRDKGESAGSGREGTASGGEDTLTRVSTQIATDTNTSIGMGGMGEERIMNETRTNEGEPEHACKRENKSNTDSNNPYDRNTAGLQSESITVGEQLFRSGFRRQRGDTGKEDLDWSDPLCDSPDTGAHSIGQDGRAATAGRKTHVDQSESAAQLLNSLLSAKRPSSAYPAGSSYSFTLTQPYTFSYYKS